MSSRERGGGCGTVAVCWGARWLQSNQTQPAKMTTAPARILKDTRARRVRVVAVLARADGPGCLGTEGVGEVLVYAS